MALSESIGAAAPEISPSTDYRFSGFCYQNWDMSGEPPIIVNPKASIHHKLAWAWGEVATLSDALNELDITDNKELRTFANFVASRLMPIEAMLNHLGAATYSQANATRKHLNEES